MSELHLLKQKEDFTRERLKYIARLVNGRQETISVFIIAREKHQIALKALQTYLNTERNTKMSTNITKEIEDMKVALAALEAKAAQPTYNQVSFPNSVGLAEAILAGRTFLTKEKSTLFLDPKHPESPFRYKKIGQRHTDSMKCVWDQFKNLQEINATPWYLRIPAVGVECYVSDITREPTRDNQTDIIARYDPTSQLPFIDKDEVSWKYATPVNPE